MRAALAAAALSGALLVAIPPAPAAAGACDFVTCTLLVQMTGHGSGGWKTTNSAHTPSGWIDCQMVELLPHCPSHRATIHAVSHAPQSCGILLFRRTNGVLEVLLAHPGGPYWQRQDFGSWSVPKGIAEPGEALEAVAAREFAEETGFDLGDVAADPSQAHLDLGEITLKSGKVVHAWAVEGDLDPARCRSNEIEIEWPPRTGRRLTIPEVDRVAWFGLAEARRRAHPAQAAFVERLEVQLGS